MNDGPIIEVISDAIDNSTYMGRAEVLASDVWTALRAAGYDIYRPDEATPVFLASALAGSYAKCERDEADGLVVPVGESNE